MKKIESKAKTIIPYILYLSKSIVIENEKDKICGFTYSLHITPFFMLSITLPMKIINKFIKK